MVSEPKVVPGGGEPDADTSYIQEVFGKAGLLARTIPGYQPRFGQISMARAVDQALRTQHHLVAEGPTGTGKSQAYSVPAAYHATRHGRRICIVTANKTLQAQIVNKDLPALQAATGWPFRFALRKGISSYLCQRDFNEGRWRDSLFENLTEGNKDKVQKTVMWAGETETGDYEESPGLPKELWKHFSTTNEECDRSRCSHFRQCFVKRAKDISAEAHITVTNYHLFYTQLQHAMRGGPGWILPPFDVAILDEAHNAADIARDFFGIEIGWGAIYRCVTNMHMVDVHGFKTRGEILRQSILDEARLTWDELGRRAREDDILFTYDGDCPTQNLEERLGEGQKFYDDVASALSGSPLHAPMRETYLALSIRCKSVKDRLEIFRTEPGRDLPKHQRRVFFVEGTGKEEKGKFVRLKAKAVYPGPFLNAALFESTPSVIQTSATLAVSAGKGQFDYHRRQTGTDEREDVDELAVASPFDWESHALLVVPGDLVDYKSPRWTDQVCEAFEQIVRDVRGRTLGLFTSFRVLHRVRDHLRGAGLPYPILAQGDGTNAELQRRFREEIDSVLLGSESFSEGVDIQGEACTCVVLDKIPFIQPNDPVLRCLEKFEDNVFVNYQVPEAVVSFKQRVGRLIRTVDDVGVIVVLDNRIHTKGYGKQFLKSIPPIRVSRSLADIGPFLRQVRAL